MKFSFSKNVKNFSLSLVYYKQPMEAITLERMFANEAPPIFFFWKFVRSLGKFRALEQTRVTVLLEPKELNKLLW